MKTFVNLILSGILKTRLPSYLNSCRIVPCKVTVCKSWDDLSSAMSCNFKIKPIKSNGTSLLNSTPDYFNGQIANFTLKPPKVIESTTYVKKQTIWSATETTLFYYSGDSTTGQVWPTIQYCTNKEKKHKVE